MLEDVAVVLNFTRDALPPCVVLLAVVLRKRSRFKGFICVLASQQPLLCKGVGAQIREWQPPQSVLGFLLPQHIIYGSFSPPRLIHSMRYPLAVSRPRSRPWWHYCLPEDADWLISSGISAYSHTVSRYIVCIWFPVSVSISVELSSNGPTLRWRLADLELFLDTHLS